MRQRLWFCTKRYGWGWTPCTWEGWLVTLIAAGAIGWIVATTDYESHSVSDTLIGSTIPVFVIVAILIAICVWKGEKPRWRWGGD
jgi:hypothetical protein